MFFFTRYYGISANIGREVRTINEPYLLLCNHYGRYDPFIISSFFKKKPNFISSDAILRDPVIGRLFKGLGAMPIKKGMRDSFIIREIVKVVKSGGAIALFPEGGRTWGGKTMDIDPSVAKLIRLLKVPVVTAKMKGAYLIDPRWATTMRRSKMSIDIEMLFTKEEIGNISENEIMDQLLGKISHDDVAWQQQKKIVIRSNKRAEQIEKIFFLCPDCHSYDGFVAKTNNFNCLQCKVEYTMDKYGFLSKTSGEAARFDNTRDWLDWQNREFVEFIRRAYEQGLDEPLFMAHEISIGSARGYDRISAMGVGKIEFYVDRIEVVLDAQVIPLYFKEMSSIGAQFMERIELYYQDYAYKFESKSHFESGLKWELATNVIWSLTTDKHKVAAYFSDLLQ